MHVVARQDPTDRGLGGRSSTLTLRALPTSGPGALALATALTLLLPTRARAAQPVEDALEDASAPEEDASAEAESEPTPPPAPAPAPRPESTPPPASEPSATGEAPAQPESAQAAEQDLEDEGEDRDDAAAREDKPAASDGATRPQAYADGFHFGSYGRVVVGGDATGRAPRDADIVARGSRMDESTYTELELRREDYWEKTGAYTRIVATVAFAHPIFHYNADFDAKLAIRNLYLEERDLGVKGLGIWAGSRMYRGDDIYALDFWPLDNLNTIGGGLSYDFKSKTSLRLHAGLNQPTNPFYRQFILRSPVHNQLGETEVALLDRQKLVSSARVSQMIGVGESGGVKLVGYGELHWTPSGQRELSDQIYEDVPSDMGFVAGGEVSLFTGKRSGHLNLYGRYAGGLAAYGEWGAPSQLALDRTASGAHEWIVALGGNYEAGPFGLLAGAYLRSFRNASPALDFDDVNEGIFLLRPQLWLTKKRWLGLALEGSYQAQQRGVSVENEDGSYAPLRGSLVRVGLMPFISPAGEGSYTRPHIRLMYLLTSRDAGARSLYPDDDVFARRKLDHFIGLSAEWWFGSTSYFRN
ncbi:MAG: carbohydrate porin [Myxococcales bacterium]|nr:carbohydrate porin [Myxococcales bacterium]